MTTRYDRYIPMLLRGEARVEAVPLNGELAIVALQFFVDLMQAILDEHRTAMIAITKRLN